MDESTVRADTRSAGNPAPERQKRKRTEDVTDGTAGNPAPGPNPLDKPSNPMAPRELMADDVAPREADRPEDDEDLATKTAETPASTVSLEDAWREAYPEFVHPGIPSDDFGIIAEKLDAMTPEERLGYRERGAGWAPGRPPGLPQRSMRNCVSRRKPKRHKASRRLTTRT